MPVKLQFKEVKFEPSMWRLHLWKSKKMTKELSSKLDEYYGEGLELDDVDLCYTVESAENSKLNGDKLILLIWNGENHILVHELIHALWHYSKCSGVEMDYNTQEWQALLFEHLYSEAISSEKWETFKKEE